MTCRRASEAGIEPWQNVRVCKRFWRRPAKAGLRNPQPKLRRQNRRRSRPPSRKGRGRGQRRRRSGSAAELAQRRRRRPDAVVAGPTADAEGEAGCRPGGRSCHASPPQPAPPRPQRAGPAEPRPSKPPRRFRLPAAALRRRPATGPADDAPGEAGRGPGAVLRPHLPRAGAAKPARGQASRPLPAAKTGGRPRRSCRPLEKITDPRDLAEALRQTGAKKAKEVAAKAAERSPREAGGSPPRRQRRSHRPSCPNPRKAVAAAAAPAAARPVAAASWSAAWSPGSSSAGSRSPPGCAAFTGDVRPVHVPQRAGRAPQHDQGR